MHIPTETTVYLAVIHNKRFCAYNVVGLMSYREALACVERSSDPSLLLIIDPNTGEALYNGGF